jgi:D-alanyl-D-alanine carboxypeptidase (penicillin-binding protein 5/6)
VRPYARTPISALALTLCALVVTATVGPAGVADAAKKPTTPPMTTNATVPASSSCPDHVTPPPPVDASEQPVPGQATPAALPEPSAAIGGAQLGECGVIVPAGAPAAPADVNADAWLLEDLDTGAVLAAKDPHARERPASLIKLLLSLVVTRELNPNSTVTATQDDANQPPTRVGILPGAAYPVTDLIDALLMKSGNDVAYALATALGGLPAATQKMDALANQLGALDTRAATPSGLDGPGMSASAYDLAVIFRAAMTNQIISTAVQTKTLTLPASNGQPAVSVTNENSLLMGEYSPKYPGEIGGKTGYTSDAQHTYADAAEQNGHRVALIMMRNSNNLPGVYKNATELLDYGFQLDAAKLPPVGQVVDSNPLAAKATTAAASTKDKAGPSDAAASDANAVRAARTPDDPISPFGTVGMPLTILAGVVMLLILLLVLRRRAAKKKRADRAKQAVAEKRAADAAKAAKLSEAAQAAARPVEEPAKEPVNEPSKEPESKPSSTLGDTASWAAVDEAFAEMAQQRRPVPKRVGTGTPPGPRNGTAPESRNGNGNGDRTQAADIENASDTTEVFGRLQ